MDSLDDEEDELLTDDEENDQILSFRRSEAEGEGGEQVEVSVYTITYIRHRSATKGKGVERLGGWCGERSGGWLTCAFAHTRSDK